MIVSMTQYDISHSNFFPDIQIGFSNTSLIIDSTELSLDVSNYHGIMQSGEISTVQLQVESLSGMKTHLQISILKIIIIPAIQTSL